MSGRAPVPDLAEPRLRATPSTAWATPAEALWKQLRDAPDHVAGLETLIVELAPRGALGASIHPCSF